MEIIENHEDYEVDDFEEIMKVIKIDEEDKMDIP